MKFDFGTVEFDEIANNFFGNDVLYFIFAKMRMMVRARDRDMTEMAKIQSCISLCEMSPMIQIKCQVDANSQKEEIIAPYFIADPSKLNFQEVSGSNRIKLMNRDSEILELDPKNVYAFTLKKRGKTCSCF